MNGQVGVRLVAKDGANDKFRGFLLMAFDAVNDNQPIGYFIPPDASSDAKIVECPTTFTPRVQ